MTTYAQRQVDKQHAAVLKAIDEVMVAKCIKEFPTGGEWDTTYYLGYNKGIHDAREFIKNAIKK